MDTFMNLLYGIISGVLASGIITLFTLKSLRKKERAYAKQELEKGIQSEIETSKQRVAGIRDEIENYSIIIDKQDKSIIQFKNEVDELEKKYKELQQKYLNKNVKYDQLNVKYKALQRKYNTLLKKAEKWEKK